MAKGKNKNKNRARNVPPPQKIKPTPPVKHTASEVSEIIDSSPATLDEVKEIAKQEKVTIAKANIKELNRPLNEKTLIQTWNHLESAKATYEGLIEKNREESQKLSAQTIEFNKNQTDLAKKEKLLLEHAENIENKKRELVEKEINASAGFIKQNTEALAALEKQHSELSSKLTEIQTSITTEVEKKNKKLASVVDKYKAEIQELEKKRSKLEDDQDFLKLDREILEDKKNHIIESIEMRALEISEETVEKNLQLENKNKALRETIEKLESGLKEAQETIAKYSGVDLQSIKNEAEDNKAEIEGLKDYIKSLPSPDEANRLKDIEKESNSWRGQKEQLLYENQALKQRIRRQVEDVSEKQTNRDIIESLKTQRGMYKVAIEEAKDEMDNLTSKNETKTSFPKLLEIDNSEDFQTQSTGLVEISSLKEFCLDLRSRIAVDPKNPGKTLFYSDADIRSFVAGIGSNRIHLLQGISGTGKTSLAIAFNRAVGAGEKIIKVQAGWRDHYDILGHYNSFNKLYRETEFLQAIYEAQTPKFKDRFYIILLDEMNLSRVEQYFADMLSTLELDEKKQLIEIVSSNRSSIPRLFVNNDNLGIPNNLWFIGTANHDETTVEFADKTYDRSHVLELPPQAEPFKIKNTTDRKPISLRSFFALKEGAVTDYQEEADRAINFLKEELSPSMINDFNVGWGNRLEQQMMVYIPMIIASGGSLSEGLDHILHSKILRKVKRRHDTQLTHFENLSETIKLAWETYIADDKLPEKSLSLIDSEISRLGSDRQ
jgi:hypothetical protein